MEPPANRYAITFILHAQQGVTPKDERVLKTFGSIAEVRDWADRNNYVLGQPGPYLATYAIEHTDGSPLSPDELIALQPEDSQDLYMSRQAEALGDRANLSTVQPIHGGQLKIAIRRHIQRSRGQR